jgi:hypothetical protein
MSEGEPKSAYEIAMEKLRARGDYQETSLSDEQKAEIAELRNRHKAKIAELEIKHQGDLRQAIESGSFEDAERLQEEFAGERARLEKELEAQVEKVRQQKK